MKSNIKNLAFFRDLIEFEKHSDSFLGLYTPPSLPVCCISDNVSPLQCLPEESIGSCPPPACLPGHVVQMVVAKTSTKSLKSGKLMAPDADVDDCPKYHCIPPGLVAPEQEQEVGVVVESRCRLQGGAISFFVLFFYFSIQGRSLSTFDGLQLKVDLCHHTLLQSTTGRWSVQCKIFAK